VTVTVDVSDTTLVSFEVLGLPRPQGSKRSFLAKNGKVVTKETSPDTHAAWRNQIAQAARDIAEHADVAAPFDGCLTLAVTFRFPMPKSRPKRIRESGQVAKTTAPDVDKLLRTVLDGLTAGGLITDDARVAHIGASKYEVTGWTGAVINLREGEP